MRRGGGHTYDRDNEGPGDSVEGLDRGAPPCDEAFARRFSAEFADRGDWVVGGGDHGEVGFVGEAVFRDVVV